MHTQNGECLCLLYLPFFCIGPLTLFICSHSYHTLSSTLITYKLANSVYRRIPDLNFYSVFSEIMNAELPNRSVPPK